MDIDLFSDEERKFKCDECGRAYRHAGSLSNHKKTHDVGSFQCNICGKENSNALALKNHLRIHTSQKKYPCLECGKAFNRMSQLANHERVHESRHAKEQSADEGDLEYFTHIDPNGHTDFLSSAISTLYNPSEDIEEACANNFENKPVKVDLDEKSNNYQEKKNQTEIFECTVCFKLFSDIASLDCHQNTHECKSPEDSLGDPYMLSPQDEFSTQHQNGPVNFCHLCQELFSSEDEFQDHIQIHNSSSLLDHSDGKFYTNGTSEFHQPPSKYASSESSQSHNGSFDVSNEQIKNNDLFYNGSNVESASLSSSEIHPSTSATNIVAQNNVNTTGSAAEDSEERPFRCEVCFKTYRHYGSLANHKKSHLVGNYQCPVCQKRCPHLAALKNHLRKHKGASSHYEGNEWLQSQTESIEDQLQELPDGTSAGVETSLNSYIKKFCDPIFASDVAELNDYFHQQNIDLDGSAEHLEENMDQVDFPEQNDFTDESNQFPENVSMDNYSDNNCVEDEEDEDDRDFYQCSFCGNRYNSIGALRNHMRRHILSRSIPPSSNPSKQIKDEDSSDVVICSLCGETFSNDQDLASHQVLHSTDHTDDLELSDNKDSKNLICGRCGVLCTSYNHLESHACEVVDVEPTTAAEEEMNDTNTEADTSVDKEERQFKCEECGRSYRHSGSLLNHKKSHKTGLFRCHVCQKNFYNLLALKSHQRSHFDVKRFTCNECGKAYKILKQLLNHQKRHKKEKLDQTPTQSKRRRPVAEVSPLPVQDVPLKTNSKELPGAQSTDSPIKSEDGSDKRPYACDLCGRTYRHAGSLINHKKSHKTGEYACTVCNNSYSNQLAMKNHLRTHFALEKHFCLKCGKRLRSKKQLLVHVCSNLKRNRKGVRSKRVKAVVSSVQTKQPAAKEPRVFTCNICNRSYRHAGSLLNHKNTHKTGHYTCTFCSKHFPNLLALRNHTRIHTQKKKFACQTCGKAFRVASLLFNHMKIHTRRSPSCNDCGASFRGRSGLQRHQCPQGPQGPQVPQQSGTSEPPADKCFKKLKPRTSLSPSALNPKSQIVPPGCDVCGRSYRHAGSLLNHKKTHPELLHHCSLCLQTFPDALSLHAHSQINRHCCPVCGKTFCLLPHLESHMEAHGKGHKRLLDQNGLSPHPDRSSDEAFQERADGEDKVYACEVCGRTYRHPGSLLNHKNSHKTGSFSCAVCHKEFTNLMALKNHRRIHTEAKRYQCADCGKAFRVASRLVCHRRIHTRERPFACSVCDKNFTSKSNLRNHRSVHQVDVGGFMDLDFDEYL